MTNLALAALLSLALAVGVAVINLWRQHKIDQLACQSADTDRIAAMIDHLKLARHLERRHRYHDASAYLKMIRQLETANIQPQHLAAVAEQAASTSHQYQAGLATSTIAAIALYQEPWARMTGTCGCCGDTYDTDVDEPACQCPAGPAPQLRRGATKFWVPREQVTP